VVKLLATPYIAVGQVTATSQAVEAATSVSSTFVQDTSNDGLVGLAFSSINTVQPNPVPTFFDNVKSSLTQALFAADLQKGQPGSYDFGVSDLFEIALFWH
jgi:aspergillopepsin I